MAERNRLVLPATCQLHGVAGFTNLSFRYTGNTLIIDPHAVGACTTSLCGENVEALLHSLQTWLGFGAAPRRDIANGWELTVPRQGSAVPRVT